MPLVFRYIIQFIVLVLFQILVLNHMQFLGYINIYLYILFIISLPLRTPRWLILLLGFLLGMVIDIPSNTLGVHMFATVLIAFLRTPLINLFTSVEDAGNLVPSVHSFGLAGYLKYVGAMVLIHHFALFYMEAFSFTHFWIVFLRALLSAVCTFIVIVALQLFNTRKTV